MSNIKVEDKSRSKKIEVRLLDKTSYEFTGDKAEINSDESKKVLTNLNEARIMKPVIKAKRKDDKMAYDRKQKNSNKELAISIGWLVFAFQQGFVGYMLVHSHDAFVVVNGIVSLGLACVIVGAHFIRAHR